MTYYNDDLSTLICGDTIEEMDRLIENGFRVDKIITSPPYNTTRHAKDQGYDLYRDGMDNEEYIEWTVSIFERYDKILNKDGCVCYNLSYGAENTEAMSLTVAEILKKTDFTIADVLVWKKPTATPNNTSSNKMTRIVEFVYVFCRRSEFYTFKSRKKETGKSPTGQSFYENMFNFFTAPNNSETQDLNKATFSTEFVDALIMRYVLPDDIVLDNFVGTGTTLVECRSQGIRCIGIELSPDQCEYARKRLERGVQITLW